MRTGESFLETIFVCAATVLLAGCPAGPSREATPADARARFEQGEYDAAAELLLRLEQQQPGDTGLLSLMVRNCSARGRSREACRAYGRRFAAGCEHDTGLLRDAFLCGFRDSLIRVREHAVVGAGELGLDIAYDSVCRALGDRNRFVRQYACEAIGRYRREGGYEVLIGGQVDDYYGVRAACVTAVAEFGDADALDYLRLPMHDPNELVKMSAAMARLRLGDRTLLPFVVREVAAPQAVIRVVAATCLVQTGDRQYLRYVVEGLGSDDELARQRAVAGIGLVGDADHLDDVVALAGDSSPMVRSAVASAVGRLDGRSRLPVLERLSRDEDPEVRFSALVAMARSAGPEAESLLVAGLADSTYACVGAAAGLLDIVSGR